MTRKPMALGYSEISVEVKPFELEISPMIWDAFKMTWRHLHNKEFDPTDPEIIQACMDVVTNAALPTPKESIKFQFQINNISRVCLAQITRGRIGWWYVVESQMPEFVDHGVTVPFNLATSGHWDKITKLVRDSQTLYEELRKEGYPPQDLRYLLIHGQQCSMIADVNFAALPGFFAMRTENGLTDELNLVARMMRREIINEIRTLHENSLDRLIWEVLVSQLDTLGAKQQKCLIYDRVFGNTGRFPSGHDRVVSSDEADFDFKKSAWYEELKLLPDDLLLPGEKEMIEKWREEQ